ncbi:MAG: hypothetical protein EKK51_27920 [Mycolicibacterium sp.]|uniref:phosphotransferase n=1 Tax=Mycolicibacterium sp. TaxID=2320850 RepID=UPI000FB4792E|nr:phosphotransferase [Mycolicibacterium sp.]RUP27139.1 MAG: hypothetical protein EKK51_27920 [Mycolicibacterium sp.]
MTGRMAAMLSWALDDSERPTRQLVDAAESLVGYRLIDLELIRIGSNAIFADRNRRVAIRVQAADLADEVMANLDLVIGLSRAAAPLVGPLVPTALRTEAAVLTAWPLGDAVLPTEVEILGSVLADLHASRVPRELPTLDIQHKLEARLSQVRDTDLPAALRDSLEEHIYYASTLVGRLSPVNPVLLHGDAHTGNLVELDHRALLIDLDDLCKGPREFDLIPAFVAYKRFHRDRDLWLAFRNAYGHADWETVESLALVRETTMNTWLAGLWSSSQTARDELTHRIDTWDLEGDLGVWRAL